MIPVFVYGSLKRGFHNHHLLTSSTLVGEAASVDNFHMWGWSFPYIAPAITGLPVAGELYHVDLATLARLDRLEGHPHHYRRERRRFLVHWPDTPEEVTAWVYISARDNEDEDEDNPAVSTTDSVLRWLDVDPFDALTLVSLLATPEQED